MCHLYPKLIGFYYRVKSVYCAVRTGCLNKTVCSIYLRTNRDLCFLYHKLIGFYKPDEMFLKSGTDWVFKSECYSFVLKELMNVCSICLTLHNILCGSEKILRIFPIQLKNFPLYNRFLKLYSPVSLSVPIVKRYTMLRSANKVNLCFYCGSQNKQSLIPYTALTD